MSTPVPIYVPDFLARIQQEGDAVQLAYWAEAISEIRDAALHKDAARLDDIVDRLVEEGHAEEIEELLERIVMLRTIADAMHTLGIRL